MIAPTTAVVICAYTMDRWDDLSAALHSVSAQSLPPDEIWLVVDHHDRLLNRAEQELRAVVPGLNIVANSRTQGLSGARNTALEHVSSEVVAFVDDDATAAEDWLERLTAPYRWTDVIAVGGAARPRWPSKASRPVTLPAAGPAAWGELDWVVGCSYRGQPGELAPVRNLMGCNMSYRMEVFRRVGGFSEHLGRVGKIPLGCEETELCIRARRLFPGGNIVFEPAALVSHHVSPDRLTWGYLRRRCYAEGLSKAAVARMVGQDQALENERHYVTHVLPAGALRQLAALRKGRVSAVAGAGAIMLGLGVTCVGYLRARISKVAVVGDAPTLDVPPLATHPAGLTPQEKGDPTDEPRPI